MHTGFIFEKIKKGEVYMDISNKLRELREQYNYSQDEIAKKIEISRVQYNQYENNYFTIPIKHLLNLCNFYNISIDYIFDMTELQNYKNIKKDVNKIEAGNRLKEFRKENKLTQTKLASILNTTFSSIAFNEKGRNLIATPFLYTICKKYNISADYLLGRIDNPKYIK